MSESASVEKVASNEYRIVTHIDINAPAVDVWTTLTDWDNLATWSSSFVSLEGDFVEGGHVKVVFKVLGATQSYEHDLIDFIDGSQFAWSDPFLVGMTDYHTYRVEAINEATTRFHQTDQVSGGAAAVIGRLMSHIMKNMYAGFNQQLKDEVHRRLAVE